ncbi:TPA: VIT family protein [Streptococcus agalactiae]|nr:VIT family protein [Streptococcus agalactiae]
MKEAKNFSQQLNILRAGVLGANDGIISVAGVVIGVASATHNLWIIFLSAVAREEKLLENNPELAKKSLVDIYLAKGESHEHAQWLVDKAFSKNAIEHLVEEKYGIEFGEYTSPWHAAISSFIAFAIGSIFPTITILLLPFSVRIVGTVIIVIVSLLSTGYVSAKLGQAPTVPAMRRNVMIGCLTMLATYVIGQLFSI